ncbi:MAG: ribonuclease E inhibitor RraB [Flavobacteriaceae bacterium]|nr:ribonuclease E inhibitor RraB [Flavobacteriaceae bacterium]
MEAIKENLITIFQQMKNDGVNLNEDKQWNFFFIDSKHKNIEKMEKWFQERESFFTEVYQLEDDYWCLKASIVKLFNAESLHAENIFYNKLIKSFNVELYDGWDVDV